MGLTMFSSPVSYYDKWIVYFLVGSESIKVEIIIFYSGIGIPLADDLNISARNMNAIYIE